MDTYVQKMNAELRQLEARLLQETRYSESAAFKDIDKEDQDLLKSQISAMMHYRLYLTARIGQPSNVYKERT